MRLQPGGAVWARQSSAETYHRVPELVVVAGRAEAVRVLCGLTIKPNDSYHCDPKAGEDATPCVGRVCEDCRGRA